MKNKEKGTLIVSIGLIVTAVGIYKMNARGKKDDSVKGFFLAIGGLVATYFGRKLIVDSLDMNKNKQ